jgi:Flp pilus assembly protein TadG
VSIRHARSTAGAPRESGQALVEFAFVAPILVLLIMAIFQFAFVIQAQMGLTNAVREAARRAAAASTSTSTEASFASWTVGQLTPSTGLLATNVPSYDSSRLVGSPTASFCTYSLGGGGQRVTVLATYRYPVFFPLLAFATDVLDGTQDGDWTLSASAQMRLESPLSSPPGASC